MESLKAIAMAPSRAEQESFAASSRRREENIRREARLEEINRINDREAREAALMNFYASEQPAQETNILSQMSPTQLTYLLGELGYDITPKVTAADTSAPTPPLSPLPTIADSTPSEVPSVIEPSTPVSALDFTQTFKPTFNAALLSGEDLTAYNFALQNPNDPRSRQILIQLGAL